MSDNALTTCLWFDGTAEEAANFYTGIFPDSKLGTISRYSQAGPGEVGQVMLVEFDINGQRFVGLNGGPDHTFNEAISFVIPCGDQAEVDYYWAKLTEGGKENVCGWLQDRYGLCWQVVPKVFFELASDPDQEKSARVFQAMLQMTKFDIAALHKAYAGE